MTLKKPLLATLTCTISYIVVLSFISKDLPDLVMVVIATAPFVIMVTFAIFSSLYLVFCKEYKREIDKCHESIKESVNKIVNIKRPVRSARTIEGSYQVAMRVDEGVKLRQEHFR